MRTGPRLKALLAGFAILMIAMGSSAAIARPAKCVLTGSIHYSGKCDFRRAGPGFSISPVGHASFSGGINPVNVAIMAPGVAEVRGLTKYGINSRWGAARRSQRDPACWVGSDFRICVY